MATCGSGVGGVGRVGAENSLLRADSCLGLGNVTKGWPPSSITDQGPGIMKDKQAWLATS